VKWGPTKEGKVLHLELLEKKKGGGREEIDYREK